MTVVASFPRVCTGAVTVVGKKPMSSQPLSNVVGTLATFFEASTFVSLNVTTFASQHSAFDCVGGGGEKSSGVDVVFSSRS